MPGRKSAKIELSEQVRQALEKRVARHTTGQQKAQRARIMLKAAEGKNPTEIARELKVSIARVALGCERWLALAAIELEDLSVEERLEALARPGAPSLEYEQIGLGHIPAEMEDRWFIYLEDDWLFFHRSWTGFCIFQLHLGPIDGGHNRIAETWVNRDQGQYRSTDSQYDQETLTSLFEIFLLVDRHVDSDQPYA